MYKLTLFILAAVFAVSLAGQYYVPRAYYTIDAEGHESAHVPLRRIRRSVQPYPYAVDANANANARANADAYSGGSASATANANAHASSGGWGSGSGGWGLPGGAYGASNPALLSAGMTRRQFGPVMGRSVSASTSVGLDSSGNGYFDQSASVH